MNVWTCKPIFPTDTLQQKIEITDFKKHFLAGENTRVLIILATTVVACLHCTTPNQKQLGQYGKRK